MVFDPITKRFIQKDHIVHGKKVLDYPIAKCKNCSKDYPKKRVDQSFCSTDCRLEWHTKKNRGNGKSSLPLKECVICGTSFPPTRPWSDKCSDECRAESRRRKLKGSRELTPTPSFKNTKRVCEYCGNEYTPKAANQRFCIHSCKIKAMNDRKVKTKSLRK